MSLDLPHKSSPHIRLAISNDEELHEQQLANSEEWRGALSLEAYMRREKHLCSQELTKEGGLTAWSLVYQPDHDGPRRMLCGCETLNKRALVSRNGGVEDVLCRGVASVFCPGPMRGRGYAGRMMSELGKLLRDWKAEDGRACLFSVLFSDIGKQFYAAHGWQPFASAGVTLPAKHVGEKSGIRPLHSSDLAELCAIDESMIRKRLAKTPADRTAVALMPDHRQIAWHHAREEFVGKELYKRDPVIKGAVVGDKPGSRVFCYWTRVWSNPQEDAPNTLHILRLVVEDDTFSDFAPASANSQASAENAIIVEAIGELFKAAQYEAAQWNMEKVMIWNPSSTVLAAARLVHPEVAIVHRDKESITSLRWYGDGPWEKVEWICNEKFGWC